MDPPPFPSSLCHGCRWLTVIAGARSGFLKCGHPLLIRYPRQPVLVCEGFSPAKEGEAGPKGE